jgi:hypothetical protein
VKPFSWNFRAFSNLPQRISKVSNSTRKPQKFKLSHSTQIQVKLSIKPRINYSRIHSNLTFFSRLIGALSFSPLPNSCTAPLVNNEIHARSLRTHTFVSTKNLFSLKFHLIFARERKMLEFGIFSCPARGGLFTCDVTDLRLLSIPFIIPRKLSSSQPAWWGESYATCRHVLNLANRWSSPAPEKSIYHATWLSIKENK